MRKVARKSNGSNWSFSLDRMTLPLTPAVLLPASIIHVVYTSRAQEPVRSKHVWTAVYKQAAASLAIIHLAVRTVI